MWATAAMPTVSSMSATVTPLFARLMIIASRSRTPTSVATSLSWIAARIAGRSGVTGTRIRSAIAKTARFISLYDGWRSTTIASTLLRASEMASVTRSGLSVGWLRGFVARAATRIPELCDCREVEQRLVRVARVLVDPALRRGAPVGQAERQPDVPGHGVRVEQQHLHVPPVLEHGGEIRRDRRLADAALGVEHRVHRGRRLPRRLDRAARQDGSPPVVVGTWARMASASTRQRRASTLHGRSTISSSRRCRRCRGRRGPNRPRRTAPTAHRAGRPVPRARGRRRRSHRVTRRRPRSRVGVEGENASAIEALGLSGRVVKPAAVSSSRTWPRSGSARRRAMVGRASRPFEAPIRPRARGR